MMEEICNFCGKHKDFVKVLISAKTPGVYICNECIEDCSNHIHIYYMNEPGPKSRCDFCGESEYETEVLWSPGAAICLNCSEKAAQILRERKYQKD